MSDIRRMIYGTIIGFLMMVGFWFSIIYISSCGFTFTCHRAVPKLNITPIPTLIPVSHAESQMGMGMMIDGFDKCSATLSDLVGAWVSADYPETDTFTFDDMNGQSCEGSFAEDIQPLFVENSLWHPGSLGCVSCHNADLTERSAGLDMTSYVAISDSGILGGGNWNNSRLHEILQQGLVPQGHSPEVPPSNPIVFAGSSVDAEE